MNLQVVVRPGKIDRPLGIISGSYSLVQDTCASACCWLGKALGAGAADPAANPEEKEENGSCCCCGTEMDGNWPRVPRFCWPADDAAAAAAPKPETPKDPPRFPIWVAIQLTKNSTENPTESEFWKRYRYKLQ